MTSLPAYRGKPFLAVAFIVMAICMAAVLQASAQEAYARQEAYASDLTATSGISAQASGDTVNVDLEVTYGQTEARSMLAMINAFRTGGDAWAWNEADTAKVYYSGLGNLVYDYELERVAMYRASELALSFSHTTLDGESYALSMIQGDHYAWGENIAAGQRTAADVFESWQETDYRYSGQGHRRNMLSPNFMCVGIGHAVCNGVHYWVQEFAAPVIDGAAVAAMDSSKVVSLNVANSLITSRTATASPDAVKLFVGDSADCPKATASIATLSTFGDAVPIAASASWKVADESIARIDGGKIVGLKAGTTSLQATLPALGGMQVSVPVAVEKHAMSFTAKARSVSVKASKLATKPQSVKAKKAFKIAGAKGKVTYKVAKYDKRAKKKITVSKAGKVTVKKGLAKGAYKLKVKVTAAGDAAYAPAAKTVTLKVKVK